MQIHKNGEYWILRTEVRGAHIARSLGKGTRAQALDRAAVYLSIGGFAGKDESAGEISRAYEAAHPQLAEATRAINRCTMDRLSIYRGDAESLPAWLESQGMGRQTVAKHLRTAKTIYAWAARTGRVGRNPYADVKYSPGQVQKRWKYVSVGECRAMIAAAPHRGWACLIGLARYAGLRRAEALSLRWDDIDGGLIHVWPRGDDGHSTTKQAYRAVPVSEALAELLLDRSLESPCEHVSGNISRRLHQIIKDAGVEDYAKPLHTLRKCCESDWVRIVNWPTVCQWMGHSASVSQKHYLRPTDEDIRKITG